MHVCIPRLECPVQYLHYKDVDYDTDDYNGVAQDNNNKDDDESRESFKMQCISILKLLIDVITKLLKVILLCLGNRTIISNITRCNYY